MNQSLIMAWLKLLLIGSYFQKNIEEKKTKFLETLSRSNFSQIAKDIRGKSDKFGSKNIKRVLQLLDNIKFAKCNLIQTLRLRCTYNILYTTEPYTKFLQYKRYMEANTRFKFEKITTEKVIEYGLVVDTEIPFLAASPDIF